MKESEIVRPGFKPFAKLLRHADAALSEVELVDVFNHMFQEDE